MFGLSKQEKNSELLYALDNSGEGLARALRRGADPNIKKRDQTALILAAIIYDSAVAEASVAELLQYGANPNVFGPEGNTALHYCSTREGRKGIISRLLAAGANPDAQTMNGDTPAMLALRKGRWSELKTLLEGGSSVALTNNKGETLLHIAAAVGVPPEITAQLLKTTVDINAITKSERNTALHMLVSDRQSDNFKLLLERDDLRLNEANRAGNMPLHGAIDQHNATAALRLIERGALVDAKNGEGHTPLQMAAYRNAADVVETLVPLVADLEGGEKPSATPLACSAAAGSIRAVKAILGAAELRHEKVGLDAPLYNAACSGHARVMELLIAAGADVNYKNENGITPLMIAAVNDQAEAIGLLLKAGADHTVTDQHNLQAYDHAVSNKRPQAKEALGRFRRDTPDAVEDGTGSTKLNDHSLEVREGNGITMTFNFWTQQVMIRDLERPAPVTVINFSELQRQQAVEEAYDRLKALGGNPPDLRQGGIQGKPGLPKPAGS